MPYSRPPITEAVIDIRAEFQSTPSTEDLHALAAEFLPTLPLKREVSRVAFSLTAGSEAPAPSQSVHGVRLSSNKNDRILQLLKVGLAYSHLPPYTEWDVFAGELKPFWEAYRERFQIESLSRVAVRFINRIHVPEGESVGRFMALAPNIPPKVTEHVTGYFMQLAMPLEDLGASFKAVVNTGIEPGQAPSPPMLLLDIDVFSEMRMPAAELWPTLQLLRRKKNEIFEASITDKVRERIA